jgi:hypothetical protein
MNTNGATTFEKGFRRFGFSSDPADPQIVLPGKLSNCPRSRTA